MEKQIQISLPREDWTLIKAVLLRSTEDGVEPKECGAIDEFLSEFELALQSARRLEFSRKIS